MIAEALPGMAAPKTTNYVPPISDPQYVEVIAEGSGAFVPLPKGFAKKSVSSSKKFGFGRSGKIKPK